MRERAQALQPVTRTMHAPATHPIPITATLSDGRRRADVARPCVTTYCWSSSTPPRPPSARRSVVLRRTNQGAP
jgi:hypothetical protein